MLDLDIAADTELGQRAMEAAERYVKDNVQGPLRKEDDWLIARAQIRGLRQIAVNEPAKVGEFSEHQRSKVAAKLANTQKDELKRKLEAEIAFWELVRGLCEGRPPNKFPWSLTRLRNQAVPAELQDDKYPPGAQLTKEQQAARKEKKEKREHWEREWEQGHYAAFFQRFCSQYLYEMSKRTTGE
jgi:hypothetical protein